MSTQNDQRDYINDYSLLRKFDLKAAKNGEDICDKNGRSDWKFIDGIDSNNQCVLLYVETNSYVVSSVDNLRMKPLAWVEGKPVYKGDVLYYKKDSPYLAGVPRTIKELSVFSKDGVSFEEEPGGIYNWAYTSDLTWDKPKVKKEGWINIYKNGVTYLHGTEEDAIKGDIKFRSNWDHAPDFVTTVRIEWEV